MRRRQPHVLVGLPQLPFLADRFFHACAYLLNVFPAELISRANGQLKHKMLFGSDFPLIAPDRWISDFKQAAFKPEVHELILKQNAIRALKLDDAQ